jgi:hypothetical protein
MITHAFLTGATAFGAFLCGLFFFRFYRRTHDGLFLAFGIAFCLLGTGQTVLALADFPPEERSLLFLFRLAAFSLILVAIIRKNRAQA